MNFHQWVESLARPARILLIWQDRTAGEATKAALETLGIKCEQPDCHYTGTFDLVLTDHDAELPELQKRYPESPIAVVSKEASPPQTPPGRVVTYLRLPANPTPQTFEPLLRLFKIKTQPVG